MNSQPPTNPALLPTGLLPGVGVVPPPPSPGGGSTNQAAVAAAALNAMKQQLGSGNSPLTTNPNLNLIGVATGSGGGNTINTPSSSPILHGQSGRVDVDQQRRQQQQQQQQQILMSLSSQSQSLLNPLEAHSLKINEYMR